MHSCYDHSFIKHFFYNYIQLEAYPMNINDVQYNFKPEPTHSVCKLHLLM